LAKRNQPAATKKKQTKSRTGTASKGSKAQASIRQVQDAGDRARDWLGDRRDYHGYLSRRESGRGAPELARHLRGDLLARQSADGGWGDLATSVDSLWRLLDLGLSADLPAVSRALDWLFGQRDQDGAFSHGCSPARHEQRICEHYISGFFSAGPASESQELILNNGQSVTSDVGARLLSSERALRLALRARPTDSRVSASVTGLRALPLYLEYGGSFTPAVLVGAIQALAWLRGTVLGELEAGLEVLLSAQAKDGTWPNVEFFFVVETLLEVRHPAANTMLRKCLPRLLDAQHKDGSWGRRYMAAQTWIGLQALERALDVIRRT